MGYPNKNNKPKTAYVGVGFKQKSEKAGNYLVLSMSKEELGKLPTDDKGNLSVAIFAAKPYKKKDGQMHTPKYDYSVIGMTQRKESNNSGPAKEAETDSFPI